MSLTQNRNTGPRRSSSNTNTVIQTVVQSPLEQVIPTPSPEPSTLSTVSATLGSAASSIASSFQSSDTPHELWGFSNAFVFLILIVIVVYILVIGINTLVDIKHIKDDWANQRCSPMIMPFASFFGENTKDNFEFCMGKIFNTHSQGYMGSLSGMFAGFTGLLQNIFDSISSLRNVIASLGGGINVIFQEFTERITNFFFQLRMSAIRIKMLMGRLYAILFSIMYMGTSGITGMTSFTHTYLFSFLNAFCFPGDTEIMVEDNGKVRRTPIKDIKIGDVLVPGHTRVTSTFRFYSRGQPMVKLGSVIVSTNHYVKHNGSLIMAGDHPNAIPYGPWDSDEPLYCLNTSDHTIPIGLLTFMDYDETDEGDQLTFEWVEKTINGKRSDKPYKAYADSCFAIDQTSNIRTEKGLIAARDIQIGDRLTTGSQVVGLIRREVSQVVTLPDGTRITPATLYWDTVKNEWIRLGEHQSYEETSCQMVSFIVVPNSQIELENGMRVRDYMEVCSPDSEQHYSAILESTK